LPDASKPLNLSTCACILAKADLLNDNGEMEAVIRPYTPISTNAQVGCFDLLVKNYGEHGKLSRHLHEIEPGDRVEFKHIPVNVKIQAPFSQNRIGMLVGGTGITPMIQALHAILGDTTHNTPRVSMLYGSRVSDDILARELLETWAQDYPEKFSLVHVLSHEDSDSDWPGLRGHIDAELIREHMPSPTEENILIVVCGPPPMYDALCGPREDAQVGGILKDLGYRSDQVYKF